MQQWVEEAGCYMDADEAERWKAENAAAAREEALAQREEELAAREEQLAEQQAAQQERESELAALEEELCRMAGGAGRCCRVKRPRPKYKKPQSPRGGRQARCGGSCLYAGGGREGKIPCLSCGFGMPHRKALRRLRKDIGCFCFLHPRLQAKPFCSAAGCNSRAAAEKPPAPGASPSGGVRSLYAYFARNIPARACGLAGSMIN